MKTKVFFNTVAFLVIALLAITSSAEQPTISGPFGSSPIQLSIGPNGLQQNKTPGFVCDLDASLGGGHFSEWGQTEEDARSIVTKKCSDKAGLLLCKRDKATCKQEK